MKAVQLVQIGHPLTESRVAIPSPGADDVLVRVTAAGVCHSDVHYRTGLGAVGPLPHTPGHEVAGIVEALGANVRTHSIGDRVALHYLVTCGSCDPCRRGLEQFCATGAMIGKDIAGGYAEFIVVPARNAMPVPSNVPDDQAAIMMCSTATVFHALRKGRLAPGERVAVFGVGGLGLSAVQLALLSGARDVFAVDLDERKLALAEQFGATPILAANQDAVAAIRKRSPEGVDVALELIGLPQTMGQSVDVVGIHGRAVMVGLASQPLSINTYDQLLAKEAEIIGCSDHLASELQTILDFAQQGRLEMGSITTKAISLAADAINQTLDALEAFSGAFRTVITP